MMSLWDALRMNMMISYQELVRTFLSNVGIFILRMTLSPARCKFRRCLIIQRGVRAAFVIIGV
ncbi:hypothetical protein C2U38_27955 (plasmid) [Citrobacter freundii complex sp. CFNIH3]|nr:hypothetical protein C2U38_27955 [Citrobacter freundii complex sp. CFNIH3]